MFRYILFFLVVTLLSGCITSGEYLALKNDVNQLKRDYYSHDRDLAVIKREFNTVRDTSKQSVGRESFDAIRESQQETNSQLLSFSKELQTLQGKFDEYRFDIEKSFRQNSSEFDSIRARLDKIEKEMTDLKATVTSLRGAVSQGSTKRASAGEESKKGEVSKKSSPDELYKTSYGYLKKGEYKKARKGFSDFLKRYKNNALSDNSQFWLGETYYSEKDYENAIIEYQKLIKSYPKSPKVPSAMLKQAESFKNIGDRKSAGVVLQLLIEKYPRTPE
ncbi:MAG TPA: tol-pal system protein YbgF, partial [Nitrospirae bacterium]|nr:tol-pal system protein YbgF [Nitrospirota bacterium]